MQIHIRKALDSVVKSFQIDNIQYLKHLRQALLNIVKTLGQEQQAIKVAHSKQINRLNSIIIQKDREIQKLKTVNQQKQQSRLMSIVSPYKVLIKNTKSNHKVINKQNFQNVMDDAFTNININSIKQNRLSLQIAPGCKKLSRVSSSNIKNRIINKNHNENYKNQYYHSNSNKNIGLSKADTERVKILISPRLFPQNLQTTQNTLNKTKKQQNQSKDQIQLMQLISPREKSERQQLRQINEINYNSQKKNQQKQSKNSSIQQKTRLCRKPSNKNKRQLVKKKQSGAQTCRSKCGGDSTIPVKTITVNQIKPR